MGFDIHGMKPKLTYEEPDIIKRYNNKGYGEMSGNEWEAYMEAKDKYEDDHPGIYFRNNVWHWHPLWDYVWANCDKIISYNDYIKGQSNSGHKISATKAKKIANKLEKLMKDGTLQKDYEEYKQQQENAELVSCQFCEGTGLRSLIDNEKGHDYESFNDWLVKHGFRLRMNDKNGWEVQNEEDEPVDTHRYKTITGCPAVVCYTCRGVGKKKPFWTEYTFSVDNVADFLKFADQSGGFQIY